MSSCWQHCQTSLQILPINQMTTMMRYTVYTFSWSFADTFKWNSNIFHIIFSLNTIEFQAFITDTNIFHMNLRWSGTFWNFFCKLPYFQHINGYNNCIITAKKTNLWQIFLYFLNISLWATVMKITEQIAQLRSDI